MCLRLGLITERPDKTLTRPEMITKHTGTSSPRPDSYNSRLETLSATWHEDLREGGSNNESNG